MARCCSLSGMDARIERHTSGILSDLWICVVFVLLLGKGLTDESGGVKTDLNGRILRSSPK